MTRTLQRTYIRRLSEIYEFGFGFTETEQTGEISLIMCVQYVYVIGEALDLLPNYFDLF